jgi:hypothetical protein
MQNRNLGNWPITIQRFLEPLARAVFWQFDDSGELPVFLLGWRADFPDPDNLVNLFMYSAGYGFTRALSLQLH